jgi:hypothetical protein
LRNGRSLGEVAMRRLERNRSARQAQ